MNNDNLLVHALIRHAQVDTPEKAQRREHLLLLERELREARRRRRSERIGRAWNALTGRAGGGARREGSIARAA